MKADRAKVRKKSDALFPVLAAAAGIRVYPLLLAFLMLFVIGGDGE